MAIFGNTDADDLFRAISLAEDFCILRRTPANLMEENTWTIGSNFGVVNAGFIGEDGNTAIARLGKLVSQVLARFNIEKMRRDFIFAALPGGICQQRTVSGNRIECQ